MGLSSSTENTETEGVILYNDSYHPNSICDRKIKEYKGEIKSGYPNGFGMILCEDGSTYFGEFEDGYAYGVGVMNFGKDCFGKDCILNGIWGHGKFTGNGRYLYTSGSIYDGDMKDDMFHGKGAYYSGVDYSGGLCILEGSWENDKFTGKGKLKYKNGTIYDGDIVNGKAHGQGSYYKDGKIQHGEFKHDYLVNGIEETSKYRYQGTFQLDKKHGTGSITVQSGTYKGSWYADTMHGFFTIGSAESSEPCNIPLLNDIKNIKKGTWKRISGGLWMNKVPINDETIHALESMNPV